MKYFLIVFFIFFSIAACAELKPVHPDESAAQTYDNRLSINNALSSLNRIDEALSSFAKLTSKAKKSKINIDDIANTDWESQNIGFPNMMSSLKGTLLKQNYLIKKYKYEMIPKHTQSSKEFQEYKQAEKAFMGFWKKLEIVD